MLLPGPAHRQKPALLLLFLLYVLLADGPRCIEPSAEVPLPLCLSWVWQGGGLLDGFICPRLAAAIVGGTSAEQLPGPCTVHHLFLLGAAVLGEESSPPTSPN